MSMAVKKNTCAPLPVRYREIEGILRQAYGAAKAHAMARAMCEIDLGAGDCTVREILEKDGGFAPRDAERMARILFAYHRGMMGHAV